MAKGLTKTDKILLEKIRMFQKKEQPEFSKKECIEIWYSVRQKLLKKFPLRMWHIVDHKRLLTQKLVEEFQEDNPNEYPHAKTFYEYRLGGMLYLCGNSPYAAFEIAGFTDPRTKYYDPVLTETPWLALDNLPRSYWNVKNFFKAVEWLRIKVKKPISEITVDDFCDNGLSSILEYNQGSPFKTLRSIYMTLEAFDMQRRPNKFWRNKEERAKRTREMVEKSGKAPTEIKVEDFENYNISQILGLNKRTVFKALREAGYDLKETDMHETSHGYWNKRKNRSEHTRQMMDDLKKPIEKIAAKDFLDYGLDSVLAHCDDSPTLALKEAGYDVSEREKMRGYWSDIDNFEKELRAVIYDLGFVPTPGYLRKMKRWDMINAIRKYGYIWISAE